MATQTFADTGGMQATALPPEEGAGGEIAVTCLHVYLMEDGSFRVKETSDEPVPEGTEPMASLDQVMQRAQEYFSMPAADDQAMAAAKAGYAKRAGRPEMVAPGGIFGE